MISFNTTKAETLLINRIVSRVKREHPDQFEQKGADLTLHMDLCACHANGCPLDLQKLLTAPAGDFGHDVFGIQRHLDRNTGKTCGDV